VKIETLGAEINKQLHLQQH